jgi:hypothetical protein
METTGLAPIFLPEDFMKRILAVGIFMTALIGSAYAHHSFAQYYFEDRTVTIEGELVKFEYRSPHAWVYVDVKDERGVARQYGAEWANPNRLTRDDIKQDTLKIGDRVIISGSPGRNPEEYKLHLKRIQRPADGWNWPRSRDRRND